MKLIDQSLSESEQLHLANRVIESELFRRSLRLREMLSFIADQTIVRHRQSVREQEIGVAIFGRRESYDTSADNIVRVNASELRRRMTRYSRPKARPKNIFSSFRGVEDTSCNTLAARIMARPESNQAN